MDTNKVESTDMWEIWYQDTFDRECPRQLEISGQGLVAGLVELWARHLYETVQENGQIGFSHFNLWQLQAEKSIEILGEMKGQTRLRQWIFGDTKHSGRDHGKSTNNELLNKVAIAHRNLILRGKTSEDILSAAKESVNIGDFIKRLSDLR